MSGPGSGRASGREWLVAAVLAELGGRVPARVFDAPPVRAGVPHVVIEEPVLAGWSAVGVDGLEGRLTLTLHDEGERPERLRRLMAGVEEALAALVPEPGEAGWRLVACRLVRGRIARAGGERWRGQVEVQVRLWRREDL